MCYEKNGEDAKSAASCARETRRCADDAELALKCAGAFAQRYRVYPCSINLHTIEQRCRDSIASMAWGESCLTRSDGVAVDAPYAISTRGGRRDASRPYAVDATPRARDLASAQARRRSRRL